MQKNLRANIINQTQIAELQAKKLQLKRAQQELYRSLPHIASFPFYKWSRDFFESRNKQNFLTAANQVSKSSTSIRKCIEWATNTELWSTLWSTKPTQFWYFYPDYTTATNEFEQKWVKEFLPKDELKYHPLYGWKSTYFRGSIRSIEFNTGITVYFKSYEQQATALQAASVYAIFCDEEPPLHLYDEMMSRLSATQGYYHAVFTPTLNQPFFRDILMPLSPDSEKFPKAFKRMVSLYDCLEYENGDKTPWTVARIKEREEQCKSDTEVLRRVYGKFVTEEGREYPAYNDARHLMRPVPIDSKWYIYSGVDIGSGGTAHPAGIAFVAVREDFKFGYVHKCWRGSKGIDTTSTDILVEWKRLRANQKPIQNAYDFAGKDFGVTASRDGQSFTKAIKDHAFGKDLLNDLFKNDMLFVFDDDEGRKLSLELTGDMQSIPKKQKADDLIDALRYCVAQIPWQFDLQKASDDSPEARKKPAVRLSDREENAERERKTRDDDMEDDLGQEIDFYNELN